MISKDVFIVEAGRSAVGRRNCSLAVTHPADVLGPVLAEVMRRAGVEPNAVGQVVGGCINKVGAQAMNVTRTAWLSHGGPETVACSTVDSQCGSSQYAVNLAASLIASGAEDVVLACGVENMSRLPIGSDASAGADAGFGKPVSRSYFERYEWASQFEGAERIATKYGITRDETDAFGLESQLRAARAIGEGRFEAQIVPLTVDVFDADGKRTGDKVTVTRDEIPRETSLERLAQLKPVAPRG
jgi:acetyl-CoA C-acetyltransferase